MKHVFVQVARQELEALLVEDDAGAAHAQDYLVKGHVDGPLLYKSIRFAIERHAVEEALRRSESRYRALIERSIQGIVMHVDGVIQLANPAMAKLLGVDRVEELIGASIFSFIEADDRPVAIEYARARLEGRNAPDHYELRAVKRDGTVIWLDVPGMSGRHLAERFAREQPAMRVLYMSGYTDDGVVREGTLEPGCGFIQKPFTPTELLEKVRDVLDDAESRR